MKRNAGLIALAIIVALAAPLAAQERTLTVPVSATKPAVDGVLGASEYTATLDLPKYKLAMARSADVLSVAISAETVGWVAVGFGSPGMDGSIIIMGYVAGGKLELRVEQGSGHAHSVITSDAVISSAAKEENGRTILELSLKSSAFIKKDQKELALIVAYGNADSFTGMHSMRTNATVKLTS